MNSLKKEGDTYVSSDGRKIKCTLKDHPHFNSQGNICSALLLVFVHICTTRAYTAGYRVQLAIYHFLTYISQYNSTISKQLKVINLTDITAEIFNGFVTFCNREGLGKHYPPALKSGIKATALETGKIPFLTLPVVSGQRLGSTEPLYEDGYESLKAALTCHIDKLYGLLELRAAIDKVAPYTYDELAKIAFNQITKDDFVYWWRTTSHSQADYRRIETIRRLKLCTDPELRNLQGSSNLLVTIEKHITNHQLPQNFISHDLIYYLPTFSEWYPEDKRVLKTFMVYGYPVGMSLDEVRDLAGRQTAFVSECDTVVKLLINRLRFSIGKYRAGVTYPMDWYFNDYFPQSIDMAAVIVFIMLQSGWNFECVASLDKDNYEHPLTGAINSDQVIVLSEKNRSQATGKGYSDPEPFFAPSDARNPYSIVSLIRLANMLSSPLQGMPFDSVSELTSEDKLNQLFLFLRESNDWFRASRHGSHSYGKYFRIGVKQFLNQYQIIDNGIRITEVKDLTPRLRPTWLKYKGPSNDMGFLTQRMHHKDRKTTDIFYDSSSQAEQKRKVQLRSEQEEVMKLIRGRKFSGLVVKQKTIETKKESSFRIFALPGKNRALWGCNGRKPTWPGADESISPNDKCYALENCWFCGCQIVFEDSLPFMIERLANIDEFLEGDNEPSFKNRMASERAAILQVIDNWGDDEAIREAIRYQKKHGPLLPSDLSLLKLIFKTGDL